VQNFVKIGMETFLLLSFVLIAVLDSRAAEEGDLRTIRQWVLFSLIGFLVLSFSLYVLVTGIIDLVVKIISKIKKCCKKNSENVHQIHDDESSSPKILKSFIDMPKTKEISSIVYSSDDHPSDRLFIQSDRYEKIRSHVETHRAEACLDAEQTLRDENDESHDELDEESIN